MIEFPCQFPIKIIFNNQAGAADEIIAIIHRHHPELEVSSIKQQLSKNRNYLSFTVDVMAQSQEKLDALYMELTKHASIKMVL